MDKLSKKRYGELLELQEQAQRDAQGRFLISSPHLVEEALKHQLLLEVYCSDNSQYPVPTYSAFPEQLKKLARTTSAPKVVGLCRKPDLTVKEPKKILILDGLQDPGNVGTLIRSAAAFHFDAVYLLGNGPDQYHEKVQRAAQGCAFFVPVERKEISALIALKDQGFSLVAAAINGQVKIPSYTKLALIIGSEADGISHEVQAICTDFVRINICHYVDSLNAAVAGSILMYQMGGGQ